MSGLSLDQLGQISKNRNLLLGEICRRSFRQFIEQFWGEIIHEELYWAPHLDVFVDELESILYRVERGEESPYDLVVNVPPGTTKSTVFTRMFPVWAWTRSPWLRFLTTTYSSRLSLEHADDSRDLIRSTKFRSMFPELAIRRDKELKSNYKLEYLDLRDRRWRQGGSRYSTSVGGTTLGVHAHIILVDDPLDPNRAVSEAELRSANHYLTQTLSTRKADKAATPTIIVQQRLSQRDPSGDLLDRKPNKVRHVCLPGEIRSYPDSVRPPELKRIYQDDLLDPLRLPWSVLQDMEADLGQYGYAAQVGQTPVPPGGEMFKVDQLENRVIDQMPAEVNIVATVRYWDKAATEGGTGSRTAGTKMSLLRSGRIIVRDVKAGRWSPDEREDVIRDTAEADGSDVRVYVEQEPGSGGKESAQSTIRNLAGFDADTDKPTGDKKYRADPYSVQVNHGNVMLLRGDWNRDFIEEHRSFPYGKRADMVDSAAGAYNKITAKKRTRQLR